ncbi:MAG: FG-GAP repeat protein [Phycisphaeraceae bacterium]|nr:FG-GAP repeat protein [Phycisphaeraceae bacterium]MCB9847040.1 FG-GAP repeat protein [Phycisphaeraceae bacterium]
MSVVLAAIAAVGCVVAAPAALAGGSLEFKLLADDAAGGDNFGLPVDVSGNIAVVGSYQDDDNGDASGAAYLFDVTTGLQLHKLLPNDGGTTDWFGREVAIDGNLVVVGAQQEDQLAFDSGAVYIFDATTGMQLHKLVASDGDLQDYFGSAVAISGTTVLIGAFNDEDNNDSGSAYVFDANTGMQLAKIVPSDGAGDDQFGSDVALDGNIAVIGSRFDDDNGNESGSAYVIDLTTGMELFKLTASDGAMNDWFGSAIAVSGNRAIIGVGRHGAENGANSGAAYVFNLNSGLELFELLPDNPQTSQFFGNSVALDGNQAIVGAQRGDGAAVDSGTAYRFNISTGQQEGEFFPQDGMQNDGFGLAVAIDGSIAVVGAFGNDEAANQAGAAYVFSLPICPASDINGDGVVDTADLGILLGEFGMTCP